MSTPILRAAAQNFRHRLLTTAAQVPYRTPGPPITRPRTRDRKVMGPYELPGEPTPTYPKRRSPYRRTTALINALNREEALSMIHTGRAIFPARIPVPRSGDIIRITYVSKIGDQRTMCFTGICMSIRNSGVGSTIVLRNVVDGVAVERGFPIYSPLIVDAELLGKRKVRRAKLYYLRDKPLKDSTIKDATKRPVAAK